MRFGNDARFGDQGWIAARAAADRNNIMELLYHLGRSRFVGSIKKGPDSPLTELTSPPHQQEAEVTAIMTRAIGATLAEIVDPRSGSS
jgi:hypothetical protein